MLLTVIGLAITTIVSIEGTLRSDRARRKKLLLVTLAIAGFGIALVSTYSQTAARRHADADAQAAKIRMTDALERLKSQQALLNIVNSAVSDLAILNNLATDKTLYYVQIAAASDPRYLEQYKSSIEAMFPGAASRQLVAIRDPEKGSHMHKLVFGQHLHAAAAEVFHRLAMSHGFPPHGENAEIHRER